MTRALLLLAASLAWSGPDAGARVVFDSPGLPVALDAGESTASKPAKVPVTEGGSARKTVPPNVVFVTLDGIRHLEMFSNAPDPLLTQTDTAPTFPNLHSRLAAQGVLYGDEAAGNVMSIANFAVLSQPAYASMMVGKITPCMNNECPRVAEETLPERLVRELSLKPEQVATFTTWDRIALTVEHNPGATKVLVSSTTSPHDPDMWAKAVAYLKSERPRFLYIALGDADDQGHAGDYPAYLASLRRYDSWLSDLAGLLDSMGDYGANTTLIVTTDHSRGTGTDWRNHGGRLRTATRVWLYARGPNTRAAGRLGKGSSPHTHLDIRPTIEALLGLAPLSDPDRGSVLPELLPPPVPQGSPTTKASDAPDGGAPPGGT